MWGLPDPARLRLVGLLGVLVLTILSIHDIVSIDSVKLALGLAATHKHKVLSFDVSGAFLNSRPSRTVFVKLPEGYRRVDANNQEL